MVKLLVLGACVVSLIGYGLSTPVALAEPARRPLVIWHGMGDSHSSTGMVEFMNLIKEVHPGIFIHSVHIKDDLDEDQKAGFVSAQSILTSFYPHTST